MSDVASPCNSVCKVDPASGVCIGCFRSLDEIAAWSTATDGERLAIKARAIERQGTGGTLKNCSRCRTPFMCCAGGQGCWCASLPAVKPTDGECLCPMCLRAAAGRSSSGN